MSEKRSLRRRIAEILRRASAGLALAFVWLVMTVVILGLPYWLIRSSSEELPNWLHAVVLALAALLLGFGIYMISTQALRKRWFPWIFEMFGPTGPPVYCGLIVVTAASVMASFTFMLFDAGLVEMSSELPGGVSEGRLVDFYIWHFFELIPLVSINETANLAQPVTYTGTWVGVLVLVYQGVVVGPVIATVRYYFKDEGREARARYLERRRLVNQLRTALGPGTDSETRADNRRAQ